MQITWLFYLALNLQQSCLNPHQVVLYGYLSEANTKRLKLVNFSNVPSMHKKKQKAKNPHGLQDKSNDHWSKCASGSMQSNFFHSIQVYMIKT